MKQPKTWKPKFTVTNFFYGVWRPGMLISYGKQLDNQYSNTELADWKVSYYPWFSRLIGLVQAAIWLLIVLVSIVWRTCMAVRVVFFQKPNAALRRKMESTEKYFAEPAWRS